jgi:hypothetical protein
MTPEGNPLLTDHDTIRHWAEAHGGRPVTSGARLELAFGSSRTETGEPPWDEWFRRFDEQGLALRCDPSAGSTDHELVARLPSMPAAMPGTTPSHAGPWVDTVPAPVDRPARRPKPRTPAAAPRRKSATTKAKAGTARTAKPGTARTAPPTRRRTPARTTAGTTAASGTRTERSAGAPVRTAKAGSVKPRASPKASSVKGRASVPKGRVPKPRASAPKASTPNGRSGARTVTTLARRRVKAQEEAAPAPRRRASATVRARGAVQTVSADRPTRKKERSTSLLTGAKVTTKAPRKAETAVRKPTKPRSSGGRTRW